MVIPSPLSYFDISTQEHVLLDKLALKGRKQELRTLLKILSISKTGMGKTVLISGSQGMGKSSILTEATYMTHQWLGGKSISLDASWWFTPEAFSTSLIQSFITLRDTILEESLKQLQTMWEGHDVTPWHLQALLVAHTQASTLHQSYRQKRQTLSQEVLLKTLRQTQGGVLPIPAKLDEKQVSSFFNILLNPWLHVATEILTLLSDPNVLQALHWSDASQKSHESITRLAEAWATFITGIARGLYQSERCLLMTLDHWESIAHFDTTERENLKLFLSTLLQKLSEEKHLPVVWLVACRSEAESWVLSGTLSGELRQKILLGPLSENAITQLIEQDKAWEAFELHTPHTMSLIHKLTQGVPSWLTALYYTLSEHCATGSNTHTTEIDETETLHTQTYDKASPPSLVKKALLGNMVQPILKGSLQTLSMQVWHPLHAMLHLRMPLLAEAVLCLQSTFQNHCFTYEQVHLSLQKRFLGWEATLSASLLQYLQHFNYVDTQHQSTEGLGSDVMLYRFNRRGLIPYHPPHITPPSLMSPVPLHDSFCFHTSPDPMPYTHTDQTPNTRSTPHPTDAPQEDTLTLWIEALKTTPDALLLQLNQKQRLAFIKALRQYDASQLTTNTDTTTETAYQQVKRHLIMYLEVQSPASKRLACLHWLPLIYPPEGLPLVSEASPLEETLQNETTLQLMKLYAQVSSDESQAILECLYAMPQALPLALSQSSSLETRLKPMISFTHHPLMRATLWQVIFHSWCVTKKHLGTQHASEKATGHFTEAKTLQKLYHWLLQDPSSQVIFSGLKEGIQALDWLSQEESSTFHTQYPELFESLKTHTDERFKVMAWRIAFLKTFQQPVIQEKDLLHLKAEWEPWLQSALYIRTPELVRLLFEFPSPSLYPTALPEWLYQVITTWLLAPEADTPSAVKHLVLEVLSQPCYGHGNRQNPWYFNQEALQTLWCSALVTWLTPSLLTTNPHATTQVLEATATQAAHYALAWYILCQWLQWHQQNPQPLAPSYRQALQGILCLASPLNPMPHHILLQLDRLLSSK